MGMDPAEQVPSEIDTESELETPPAVETRNVDTTPAFITQGIGDIEPTVHSGGQPDVAPKSPAVAPPKGSDLDEFGAWGYYYNEHYAQGMSHQEATQRANEAVRQPGIQPPSNTESSVAPDDSSEMIESLSHTIEDDDAAE